MKERVGDLRGQRLTADFFNRLLAPDLPSELLRWMNSPDQARAGKTPSAVRTASATKSRKEERPAGRAQ